MKENTGSVKKFLGFSTIAVQTIMAADKEMVTSLFSTAYNRLYKMFLFIHMSATLIMKCV